MEHFPTLYNSAFRDRQNFPIISPLIHARSAKKYGKTIRLKDTVKLYAEIERKNDTVKIYGK
jgi:hypothetical protein